MIDSSSHYLSCITNLSMALPKFDGDLKQTCMPILLFLEMNLKACWIWGKSLRVLERLPMHLPRQPEHNRLEQRWHCLRLFSKHLSEPFRHRRPIRLLLLLPKTFQLWFLLLRLPQWQHLQAPRDPMIAVAWICWPLLWNTKLLLPCKRKHTTTANDWFVSVVS